jgi:hypothetical protein
MMLPLVDELAASESGRADLAVLLYEVLHPKATPAAQPAAPVPAAVAVPGAASDSDPSPARRRRRRPRR